MSDTAKEVRLSLKVMVNKEKAKVLFAEADSDFVDVLLSFLTLPLGRIVKLLEKHCGDKSPVCGSITSLYRGLANLDDFHFSTSDAKLMLLDPPSSLDSICRQLKLNITDSQPTRYYVCDTPSSKHRHENMCMYYAGTWRCICGRPLNTVAFAVDNDSAEGFTTNTASFLISNDLRMVPSSTSFFQTLTNLGIAAADGAEQRNVTFGADEIKDLLKCCLLSKTPLSDYILNNGEAISSAAQPQPGYFLHQIEKDESGNSKKIILKAMVQKSTNRLLFALADNDFIELLFSFLIIPVGGVESLLDTNTSLKNLDNLYRSTSDVMVDDKYFITLHTKNRLMNPNIPRFYVSTNTFLPLIEESPPNLRLFGSVVTSLKSPNGVGNFVKESTTYIVSDDLTVTPFFMSLSLSILNSLNIPLSDVDEMEVHIGLKEGLSILNASLTSKSALTNGLAKCILKKQPKQEH